MAIIDKSITKAKQILDRNGVIGLPTETVYGLAGNALKATVVAEIFNIKSRPQFDPLILHCASLTQLEELITDFPAKAMQLAKVFWPGPLTLLLPRNNKIPDITCSGLERAAFRIPNHPLTLNLLKSLDYPLAAPSANPFGYISPTSAQHVNKQLGDKIPFILEGQISTVGIESTIVGFEDDEVVIYRLGGLEVEAIEKIVGPAKVMPHSSSSPEAPGMLKSHYAPGKTVICGNISELINEHKNKKIGVLSFSDDYSQQSAFSFQLSKEGNMYEAASNLFSFLRKLDSSKVDIILTELVPEEGLGLAINDRLKRASVN